MSESQFDENASRENLKRKEIANRAGSEELRRKLLSTTMDILHKEIDQKGTEIWLIGSILKPNGFTKRSDIDIVVKNYKGDRFDLWTLLESKIDHEIEIIRFEECDFQDDILKYGLKVS
jgi:predicted nucleotidyltransferase